MKLIGYIQGLTVELSVIFVIEVLIFVGGVGFPVHIVGDDMHGTIWFRMDKLSAHVNRDSFKLDCMDSASDSIPTFEN